MKKILRSVTATALLVTVLSVHGQVTYVQKPPTVEQLQQMLGKKRGESALRSRGVEWDGEQAPAPNATSGATPGASAGKDTVARLQTAGLQGESAPAPDAGSGPAVAMPIKFEVASARVSANSMAYVDVVAQLLTKDPSLKLTIEGHTDASGNDQRNLVLSWDRALSVYRALVERYGIDGRRLLPLGRGSQDPLEGLAPESAMNRRVQFRAPG